MSFCETCFNLKKVSPFDDSSNLNLAHKHIKLKHNKLIHLIHVNEKNHLVQAEKLKEHNILDSSSVSIEQPRLCDTATTQTIRNSTSKLTEYLENNKIDTFTKLLSSKEFKERKQKYMCVKDGLDTLGFTILFKNKLKITTISHPQESFDSASDESLCPKPNLNNQKPVLFYIHGVGGNCNIWNKQMEYFGALNYEIISLDLIGHGQSHVSSELHNYQFLEMALDLLLVFDMFASKQENVVIGHSYGCSFATYLAQSRTNVISKLILISGGSPHPLDYKSALLKSPVCLITMIKPCINCFFFCSAFSSCQKKPANSRDAFKISAKVLLYVMRGQIWRTANEAFHASIKQQVLLIEGEEDKFVPLEDAFDMIKILKTGYLAVISQGSHMCIMEQFDTINNLIFLFLNDSF